MKIVLTLCFVPLLAAISPHILAQPDDPSGDSPRGVANDSDGPVTEPRRIALRMTPAEVEGAMQGRADETLSPDIWIYWNFRLSIEPALQKYDTLIVYFSRGRVLKYQLVERAVLAALLRDIRKTRTPAEPEMLSEVPGEPTAQGHPPMLAPRRIAVGMTQADVLRAMRDKPDEQLAADLWIYWNFRASHDCPPHTEALMVLFDRGRVARYRLVPESAIATLVKPSPQLVAVDVAAK